MSFDHLHLLNRFVSNAKVHGQADRSKLEEHWPEVISDYSNSGVVLIFDFIFDLRFRYINQSEITVDISNFEAAKLEFGPVV